jgi:hypothetical protein
VSSLLEELSLTDLVNSTDNLLNTLIIHAVNRGAITRYFLVFLVDELLNADIVVLRFSLVAVVYLVLVRRYHRLHFAGYISFLSDTLGRFLVPHASTRLGLVRMNWFFSFLEAPDLYPCCSSMLALLPMAQRTSFSIIGVLRFAKQLL